MLPTLASETEDYSVWQRRDGKDDSEGVFVAGVNDVASRIVRDYVPALPDPMPGWDEAGAPTIEDEVAICWADVKDVSSLTDDLIQNVLALRDLEPGWDGAGAPTISNEVTKYGLKILAELCVPEANSPSVVPTTGGGLQFEWHTQACHIELEFEEADRFSLYVERRDNDEDPYFSEFGQNVREARAVLSEALNA